MANIPNIEPAIFTAGDTLTFTRTLSDYPASDGWVLSYSLINAAHKISITASASGDDHLVSVSAATTGAYSAGDYDWQAIVIKYGERHTVGTGRVTIKPDFASATTLDSRSQMRQALEALMASYVDYIRN